MGISNSLSPAAITYPAPIYSLNRTTAFPLLSTLGTMYTFTPLLNTSTASAFNLFLRSRTTASGFSHFVNTNRSLMKRSSKVLRGSLSNSASALCSSPTLSRTNSREVLYQLSSSLQTAVPLTTSLVRSTPPLQTSAYRKEPAPRLILAYCSAVLVVVGTIRTCSLCSERFCRRRYVSCVTNEISRPW